MSYYKGSISSSLDDYIFIQELEQMLKESHTDKEQISDWEALEKILKTFENKKEDSE